MPHIIYQKIKETTLINTLITLFFKNTTHNHPSTTFFSVASGYFLLCIYQSIKAKNIKHFLLQQSISLPTTWFALLICPYLSNKLDKKDEAFSFILINAIMGITNQMIASKENANSFAMVH